MPGPTIITIFAGGETAPGERLGALRSGRRRDEAIEWAKRCPATDNEVSEVRQVQELEDCTDEVRKAAAGFDEMPGKA